MFVNFSSPSNSSLDSVHSPCFNFIVSNSILSAFSATRLVLLLPISIYILHLGNQQWRQHRSFKTASHSDIFTYNLAVVELIWCLGIVLHFSGVFSDLTNIFPVVYFLYSFLFFSETGFNTLTCADRYLAVVHPVKYRELRNTQGVLIRNVSIFSVGLFSVPLNCISHLYVNTLSTIMFFSFLVISLVVVSFCSLSVLCALFRPGPGAGGGNNSHIDQSKQRAFFTVMAIMGVLCLFFLGFLVSSIFMVSNVFCTSISFAVHSSLLWLSLPCSLVLPLLYLQKAGKVRCGKQGGR